MSILCRIKTGRSGSDKLQSNIALFKLLVLLRGGVFNLFSGLETFFEVGSRDSVKLFGFY